MRSWPRRISSLKRLFEAKPPVADVAGIHRMAPANFFHWDAEGGSNALALVGTGRPAAFGDGGYALHGQLRSLGDFFNRQPSLLEKVLNGAHGHGQISRDERILTD